MRARGSLIGISGLSRPSPVSNLEKTHDLAGLLDLKLGDSRQLDASLRVISQIEVCVLAV